jgi:hypothetical protein
MQLMYLSAGWAKKRKLESGTTKGQSVLNLADELVGAKDRQE